jgi:hypothetical protein
MNAENVLPLPVGAVINMLLPSLTSLKEYNCGGVGFTYFFSNQTLINWLSEPRLSSLLKGALQLTIN